MFTGLNEFINAQLKFARDIPDSLCKEKKINYSEITVIIDQLCSLSKNSTTRVQYEAVVALSRIARNDTNIAQDLIKRNILSQLLKNIGSKNV